MPPDWLIPTVAEAIRYRQVVKSQCCTTDGGKHPVFVIRKPVGKILLLLRQRTGSTRTAIGAGTCPGESPGVDHYLGEIAGCRTGSAGQVVVLRRKNRLCTVGTSRWGSAKLCCEILR